MNTHSVKKPDKDWRGLHLCDACWNGMHFVTDDLGKKINNCNHGECECPCQKMQQNQADENWSRKQKRLANQKAQTSIVAPMIKIGPDTYKDEG